MRYIAQQPEEAFSEWQTGHRTALLLFTSKVTFIFALPCGHCQIALQTLTVESVKFGKRRLMILLPCLCHALQIVESARVKIGAGANSGKPAGFGKSDFGKSSAVFAKLQEQQDQAKAGIKLPSAKQVKAASERSKLGASTLKL